MENDWKVVGLGVSVKSIVLLYPQRCYRSEHLMSNDVQIPTQVMSINMSNDDSSILRYKNSNQTALRQESTRRPA